MNNDYYPFGWKLPGRQTTGSEQYRYGYQGQFAEEDHETGWNQFEARMYDGRIGRWMSTDPYGQYHSPYLGMGNNPINGVDPDGGFFGKKRAMRKAEKYGGEAYQDENGNWWADWGTEEGSFSKNFGLTGLRGKATPGKGLLHNETYDPSITLDQFTALNEGKGFRDLLFELGNNNNGFPAMPRGPENRHIRDPLDKSKAIDMRHFLAMGASGDEGLGLGIEVMQGLREDMRHSALNKQDIYSNNLGVSFFNYLASEGVTTKSHRNIHGVVIQKHTWDEKVLNEDFVIHLSRFLGSRDLRRQF